MGPFQPYHWELPILFQAQAQLGIFQLYALKNKIEKSSPVSRNRQQTAGISVMNSENKPTQSRNQDVFWVRINLITSQ